MSLIVSVKVAEGIVMAADSRVSMHVRKDNDLRGVMGICHYSDQFHKLFTAPNGAGISFCGEMAIEKGNLNTLLETFLKNEIRKDTSVEKTACALLEYMRSLPKVPSTIFHVCGYDGDSPELFRVQPKRDLMEDMGDKPLAWDGEGDVLARLLSPVTMRVPEGNGAPLPNYPLALNLFTLQDAVDFARYAVETTIQTMRFKNVIETVGGKVDILVITPEETKWLQKDELN